jgi:steroid delta-isomerase-like uncharacterized protein
MDQNKALIHRYYEELWNRWSERTIDELIGPDIVFRGSLGTTVRGIRQFTEYVHDVRRAFPDFHNQIEQIIAEGDTVAVRLTYSGTHKAELFGMAGTGARIRYAGLAMFRVAKGKIIEGFVLGDLETLKQQLAHRPAAAKE